MSKLRKVAFWLWNAGAAAFYIALTGFALATVVGLVNSQGKAKEFKKPKNGPLDFCKNTILEELKSPDGKKTAVISVSSCGATTNWLSGIAIFNQATGETYSGIFGLDGKPDGLTMRWTNNHTLVLSGFSLEKVLWFNHNQFTGTKIVLQP